MFSKWKGDNIKRRLEQKSGKMIMWKHALAPSLRLPNSCWKPMPGRRCFYCCLLFLSEIRALEFHPADKLYIKVKNTLFSLTIVIFMPEFGSKRPWGMYLQLTFCEKTLKKNKANKRTVEQHYKNTEVTQFLNLTHINCLERKMVLYEQQ